MGIKFSIVAPAIRSHNYKKVYDSLNIDNNTSFEVVFVGNYLPEQDMPSNFKYIYSEVNPAQCTEIAVRNSIGEYIIVIVDDLEFSGGFLNMMDFYIDRMFLENTVISSSIKIFEEEGDGMFLFDWKIKNAPVMPAFPAFKRKIWNKIGGIDRRFNGACLHFDVMMRFYEIGYSLFIIPSCWGNEFKDKKVPSSLYRKTGKKYGQVLCKKLWVKDDNTISRKRLLSLMPYDDKDILTVDQFEDFNKK